MNQRQRIITHCDFLAQRTHGGVHDIAHGRNKIIIDVLLDLGTRDDLASSQHEILQQRKLTSGECGGYTAKRLPVALVWSQEFTSREEALAAELQIKGWSRAKKEALMAGDWGRISALAKKSFVKKSGQ